MFKYNSGRQDNPWDARYCCGWWNGSSCENEPYGGFVVYPAFWIYNRTDGSTNPNNTIIVSATESNPNSTSEGSSSTTSVCSASESSTDDSLQVGLGVGIPLGLLLLASLAYVWYLRRQVKILRQNLKALPPNEAPPMRPRSYEPSSTEMTAPNGVSHAWPTSTDRGQYEIHGVPRSELENTNLLH